MKLITAIIQPGKLVRVRDACREIDGFPGMTVSKAQGCSAHLSPEFHSSIRDELTDFSGKVRIELIASEEQVPLLLKVIHDCTHTGQKGDGILWVTEVNGFLRLSDPLND